MTGGGSGDEGAWVVMTPGATPRTVDFLDEEPPPQQGDFLDKDLVAVADVAGKADEQEEEEAHTAFGSVPQQLLFSFDSSLLA